MKFINANTELLSMATGKMLKALIFPTPGMREIGPILLLLI